MDRCPAHGNRIQQAPSERSTRLARPLNQIVVEHLRYALIDSARLEAARLEGARLPEV